MKHALAATLLALAAAGRVAALVPASVPLGYVCHRTTTPPRIDGRLDEPAWREAVWTAEFVDIEGDARPRPSLSTRAKMLWDESHFYVAAELREPHLWATLTRRDSVIFQDDDFEVFVDPNGDSHEYYEFEINALGTEWDLLLPRPYKDGGKAVSGWDVAGLQAAVHLDGTLNDPRDLDRGWSVEIAFPWAALGELARRAVPPADGDQWRVNFSRVDWNVEVVEGRYRKVAGEKERNWVWSPQGVVDMHRPETWGYVQFAAGRPGTAALRPDPSGPARRWLHQVYYAQREHRRVHGRWARTIEELGVRPPEGGLGQPALQVAASLYHASVTLRLADGTAQRWNIRQDALIWPDDGGP